MNCSIVENNYLGKKLSKSNAKLKRIKEIIKFAKMLNSKKLSALRSGNISTRYKGGFLITPSGAKYSSLQSKDIVFVSHSGKFDKKKRNTIL